MTRVMLACAVLILFAGSALRFQGLHTLTTSLQYDEAYYAIDAATLLEQPRFVPFFPENYGRESAWMYLLAPFMAVFGYNAFGLRLAAALTGILTLAAVYRLGAEVFRNRWAALWTMAGLAVLYWHVHFSHLAWRALLFPCVGALAFALLWRARRTNRPIHWLAAGVLLALLAYTYFAARVWLLLAAGMLVYAFLTEPSRRRGLVIAAVTACIGGAPLLVYTLTNSGLAGHRIDDVAVSTISDVLANLPEWLRLWFIQGAEQLSFNLPGRPVLDVPLLLLCAAGVISLIFAVREKLMALWMALLLAGSAGISLLTISPENMIRMIGTVIPLALLIGAGAWGVQRLIETTGNARFALLIPVILLAWAGINTQRDVDRWLHEDLYLNFERHLYDAADALLASDDAMPVYFSPFSPSHPVLRFHAARLVPRQVRGFDASQCWILPPHEALFFNLTLFDASFAERLAQFADVEPVLVNERDALYRVRAHQAIFAPEGVIPFEGGIAAHLLADLPDTIRAGETLPVMVGIHVEQPQPDDLTLFLHLYNDPTPYDGGTLWAQADQPVCTGSPAGFWQTGEMLIQPVAFTIPAATPPGEYEIATGFYRTQTQQRLSSGDLTYAIIQRLTVTE